MASTRKTQPKGSQGKAKHGNQKASGTDVLDQELLDDIVNSLDEEDVNPNIKRLAKEISAIMLPAITTAVTSAIAKSAVDRPSFEKVKANVVVGKYETDRLEQYTRRENIRIFHLSTAEDRTLSEGVIELLNDMFHQVDKDSPPCVVTSSDISVCHRVGKKPEVGASDNRPIIVRFVSRQTVFNIMKHKKVLKDMAKYKAHGKSVFIAEDLTQLRLKLKDYIRERDGVSRVHTMDGNIHGEKNGKHFVVTSPDDLFRIDIDPDMKALGLESYM